MELSNEINDINNNKTFSEWLEKLRKSVIDKYLKNVDSDIILNDVHLSPWLAFVDTIPEEERKIVLLSELTEKTKEFIVDRPNPPTYNSKKNIYNRRNFGDRFDIYNVILEKYRNVFVTEYKIWQKLLHGREKNS